MVPAGEAARDRGGLGEVLHEGDVVIDGGNSHYADDQGHATSWRRRPSGSSTPASAGALGPEGGYALMVGGAETT